jgi:uncharacterized protein YndB with AHSA1/START domain
MAKNLVAKAGTTINAPKDKVWKALVDPAAIKQFMFGTDMTTDWKIGSPIVWKGEWQGRPYEDKGVVKQIESGRKLQYTHFSPLSGLPDKPENYHTITIELSGQGEQTSVTLSQDNNATEEDRQHSEENWKTMLDGLKKYVEGARS